jgi:hypothetical protein
MMLLRCSLILACILSGATRVHPPERSLSPEEARRRADGGSVCVAVSGCHAVCTSEPLTSCEQLVSWRVIEFGGRWCCYETEAESPSTTHPARSASRPSKLRGRRTRIVYARRAHALKGTCSGDSGADSCEAWLG